MCRVTVYYNTYGDGTRDVTERVDTCRSGKMCSHPERREVSRNFMFSKLAVKASPEAPSSVAERKPTPYHTDFLQLPPTPRSKTPSPSRKHESGVYVNGTKVADLNTKREKRHSSRREPPVVVHAPEPPAPRPFLKRSSTMPSSQHIVVEERGRRHRDSVAQPPKTSSREIAVGPVRILESLGDHGRSNSGSRRSASPRPTYHREHSRSARGYDYRDQEVTRKERVTTSRRASSFYGEGSLASTQRRAKDVYMTPPPEVQVVPPKKELRWEDQVRAQQNERIARRPKLHQEVKGILKKEEPVAEYDDLRRAVGKMDIHSSQRRVREGDEEYFDRLRSRFEEPRERRRRSKVYYPEEGLYKYM